MTSKQLKMDRKIKLLMAQLASANGDHEKARAAFAALGISYVPAVRS